MVEDEKALQLVHGRVKWFDPAKGFGFIVTEENGADILLHANVLRNYGQSSVADGAGITVKVQSTQRGVQAVEVVEIEPPAGTTFQLSEDSEATTPEEIASRPLEPGRVKWFDKGKGFGFANVFGRSEDVFIHVEVLRMSGFADLAAGEAVALRIIEGRRGRMAVQVVSWEAAARQHQQPV
ncbi:cold shock domain-containing protein [Cereibacter azotoformans]|uniref:Cold-shock DNA-binding protein family n=2 Tax=Cereibacter TaxID=1653176 RepID=A4WRE0_CERS5|nr:cold shock domain-containing protein [Cereibacter azotoformans]AXQ93155.1 cold shock domain-containing protein [Cereibacter sphaeroides]MBO4169141.1 cold shock domain-containing protein [Cereibacter azotoformans]PTR15964.1 putative cold-shock DNA-binding protein [Cereibacter azotoformans]UIJ31466.1 cold shock domain-containing protein [Cereibacter azotoformans]ULB09305.1 cold shock domain-containing protein [Cereibacter azotoformans]